MTLYAIIDDDIQIAKHLSKGTMGVFKSLDTLEKHAWRYMSGSKKYKIAELEIEEIYEFQGEVEK